MLHLKQQMGSVIPKELLLENAVSSDPTARWAAAIELGQLGDEDSAKALWKLKTDHDENVRAAADLAINELDRYVLEVEVNDLRPVEGMISPN